MMDEKPDAIQTTGVQIEGGILKAVSLSLKKGIPVLDKIDRIDLEVGTHIEDVNPLYMLDSGKDLIKELKQRLCISALSSSETLIRSLQVKLKKDKDINDVVVFQTEPLLPYPVDEAIVDWTKVAVSDEGSTLTVFAAKKEKIMDHLQDWKILDIEPEVVSTVPLAVATFAAYFLSNEGAYFVVHIGVNNTTCALVSNGRLLAAQFFSKGFKSLVKAYADDKGIKDEHQAGQNFIGENFEELNNQKDVKTFAAIESLRIETMKSLIALSKTVKGNEATGLLITGEGGVVSSLNKRIVEGLDKESLTLSKKEGVNVSEEVLLQNAVPFGLALSGLPYSTPAINFRKGELTYPKPFKRLIKPLVIYFSGALLLSAAIVLCGNAYFGFQEDKLKESYGDLLGFLGKKYEVFEAEYETKHPRSYHEGETLQIEKLNSDDLYDRLEYLENEINNAPEPIALLPNTPRVSDFLAWLCTHPNVIFCDADRGNKRPLVKIESFSYTMVKRPEEKKRGSPYQVQVEIEFSSPTPKLARELHDVLIEPNEFVDTRGEVKWSSNRGRYRTSFFLQDKTYYPSAPQK